MDAGFFINKGFSAGKFVCFFLEIGFSFDRAVSLNVSNIGVCRLLRQQSQGGALLHDKPRAHLAGAAAGQPLEVANQPRRGLYAIGFH